MEDLICVFETEVSLVEDTDGLLLDEPVVPIFTDWEAVIREPARTELETTTETVALKEAALSAAVASSAAVVISASFATFSLLPDESAATFLGAWTGFPGSGKTAACPKTLWVAKQIASDRKQLSESLLIVVTLGVVIVIMVTVFVGIEV